jgi:antagonist of KipI
VSIGGALDEGSLRWANLLVDNPPEAAALEITLLGPTLTVAGDRPLVAALTGADCAATLNGTPVAPWRSFRCDPGDTLTLGGCTLGARAYLALGGGIAVPLALGSHSTDLIGRLGGVQGGRCARATASRSTHRRNCRPCTQYPPGRFRNTGRSTPPA